MMNKYYLILCLTIVNFIWTFIWDKDWPKAADRSYFQGAAVLITFYNLRTELEIARRFRQIMRQTNDIKRSVPNRASS